MRPRPRQARSLLALLVCGCGIAPSAGAGSSKDQDWPYYGADQAGTKFSPLRDINAANVARLKLVWQWHTGERPLAEYGTTPGMFEATPVVVEGVMYLSTPYNRVVALDPMSGRERWSYDPQAYLDGQVPNGTGFVHRGVAMWRDTQSHALRVLINSRYRLVELDAQTGRPVPGFGENGVVNLLAGLQWPVNPKHYTNPSPPIVYRDLVIVGNGVADRLIYRQDPPGDVRAYDARTGREVWNFHTVPRDYEFGARTWRDESNHYTGHTNVWAPMTLDERRGLLYLPVSTPSNDFYGGNRPGANLFGDSLVCVDAATGVRRWHYQLTHHGLWDYDPPAPPNLVRIKVHGRTIDAVVQLTKQGYAFVFDRVTGEPVWPIEERAVPASDVPGESASPTQPAPVGLPVLAPQGVSEDDATDLTPELHRLALEVLRRVRTGPVFTPPSIRGTIVRPGVVGGSDWGGGAYDARTGILYVKVNDDPTLVYPDLTDADGNVPEVGPNDAGDESLFLQHRIPILKPPYAYLDALDLNHGRMLWQVAFGDNEDVRRHPALAHAQLPPRLGAVGVSGAIVTAGGLLFVGGGDNVFHAIDVRTGLDLWTYPTQERKTTGTPMTYRIADRQYVVIAVGGPGEGAALLAFALDGTLAADAQSASTRSAEISRSASPEIVARECSQCHSLDIVARARHTRKQWEATLDAMIAKGARVSDQQYDSVAGYLATHFGPKAAAQ
jgi:quinoprotein glucose dehydrogenase